MSQEISWDTKVPLINKLMIQMFLASYNRKDRTIVATQIIAKQYSDLDNLVKKDRPLYRSK